MSFDDICGFGYLVTIVVVGIVKRDRHNNMSVNRVHVGKKYDSTGQNSVGLITPISCGFFRVRLLPSGGHLVRCGQSAVRNFTLLTEAV